MLMLNVSDIPHHCIYEVLTHLELYLWLSQEEVKERAAAALVKAIKESSEGSGPKSSSTYGSRPRATSEYMPAQPSPYEPPETPKKRVTIVPAEGLDIDNNS